MKALLLFLLVPGSMALYMASVNIAGPYGQRVPYVWFGLALAGIIGLGILLKTKFTWWRGTLATLSVALAALFAWWTLSYSEYPDPEAATLAAKGAPLGEAAAGLLDPAGQPFDLRAAVAEGSATVLIFYRGFW